ncbi:DUF3850 domain-containing protein [Vibrio diazotrophicus]|uniref:DUF3850 domain-containing protein n=1 Tax=Vibrio diazotrophicus TaxID=685 RepID=UPI0005A91F01|nr:DUF3850 domain-containing protein [Vibrio diazotrophicus]
MVNHQLKIKSEHLEAIISGVKTFEIRKNDRDFKVGDRVTLIEEEGNRYLTIQINYITSYAQQDGYIVFSFGWISGGKLLGEEKNGVLPMSFAELRDFN